MSFAQNRIFDCIFCLLLAGLIIPQNKTNKETTKYSAKYEEKQTYEKDVLFKEKNNSPFFKSDTVKPLKLKK